MTAPTVVGEIEVLRGRGYEADFSVTAEGGCAATRATNLVEPGGAAIESSVQMVTASRIAKRRA